MSHGNKIDPATEIFLKQNIEEAFIDVSSVNRKIRVLPAEDGEPIEKYIKEITDDEAVELVEGIKMNEEPGTGKQCLMNGSNIQGISERLGTMIGQMYGHEGQGGLYSLVEGINDTVQGIDSALAELSKKQDAEAIKTNLRFTAIEKDVNNIGDRQRELARIVEENKESEVDKELRESESIAREALAKAKAQRDFWFAVLKSILPTIILTAAGLIAYGIRSGGL